MIRDLTIGRVAEAVGCKVQTVRYYEQIGLIPAPPRSGGNQRLYDESAIHRLTFIRHARELGFPLQAIRDIISLSDDPKQPCDAVDEIAKTQLIEVNRRIERLQALRHELKRMIHQCKGGSIADCHVLAVLSDYNLCEAEDHQAPKKMT